MPIALVADNDPGVRTLLADLVRRGNFEVRTAVDGSSARAQLEAGGLDLLVCDLDMPGLSGQQLLAWLARMPAPPLVWVVSGFVDSSIERELLAYPFVRAILRKPFDVFGFVQRLRECAKSLAAAAPTVAPSPVVGEAAAADAPPTPSTSGSVESASPRLESRDPRAESSTGCGDVRSEPDRCAEAQRGGIDSDPAPPEAAGGEGT